MKLPLSVLDLAPVVAGSTGTQALHNTLDLARLADRLGYTRYWLAEHHNMPGIASSAPEIMIGQVVRETTRMRVGSGGIMLPNHPSLKVAEWFQTLEALFPGRIDLGIGRAPGTDPVTAHALRGRRGGAEDFPQQLDDLFAFSTGDFPADHPYRSITATPRGVALPPVWLLGSSLYSARLAAELGLGFAFAHHFSPNDAIQAMQIYRAHFRPSVHRTTPHAMITVGAICAETEERADYLSASLDLFWVWFHSGKPRPLPTPEEALAYDYTPHDRAIIAARRAHYFSGSPATVRAGIEDLVQRTSADEVMVASQVHDHGARLRSFELLAEAFAL